MNWLRIAFEIRLKVLASLSRLEENMQAFGVEESKSMISFLKFFYTKNKLFYEKKISFSLNHHLPILVK